MDSEVQLDVEPTVHNIVKMDLYPIHERDMTWSWFPTAIRSPIRHTSASALRID